MIWAKDPASIAVGFNQLKKGGIVRGFSPKFFRLKSLVKFSSYRLLLQYGNKKNGNGILRIGKGISYFLTDTNDYFFKKNHPRPFLFFKKKPLLFQ